MVEKTEFADYAGVKQDAEILAGLDKQRNGMFPHELSLLREGSLLGQGDKVQQIRDEAGENHPLDKPVSQQHQEEA